MNYKCYHTECQDLQNCQSSTAYSSTEYRDPAGHPTNARFNGVRLLLRDSDPRCSPKDSDPVGSPARSTSYAVTIPETGLPRIRRRSPALGAPYDDPVLQWQLMSRLQWLVMTPLKRAGPHPPSHAGQSNRGVRTHRGLRYG